MLDVLSHFFLKFGHITVIFPIMMIGMIFHKRDLYAKAACFLLWAMIFNTLLKYLFKVPLFPHLGNGYAFPSGHMHAASAFYGYILYKTNNKTVKVGLGILLFCLGFSLIRCHFHDLFDVTGAVGFAIAELFIYHLISEKFGDKSVGIVAVISAVSVLFALSIIHKIEFHVWLAFYGLIGMESALSFTKDARLTSLCKKLTAFIMSVSGIWIVWYISNLFQHFVSKEFYFTEIRFAIIPFIIVGSMKLANKKKASNVLCEHTVSD